MSLSDTVMTLKNKDGKDFTFTLDLARDLLAVHHISLADIIPSLHGTSIEIRKSDSLFHKDGADYLQFSMKTGDVRDGVYSWRQKVM